MKASVSVRGHSFVLDYYILGDFSEVVERKQEQTGFQCVTALS